MGELAEAKEQIEHITSEREKIFNDLEYMKNDYEHIHKMAYELNMDNKNKSDENIRLNEMTHIGRSFWRTMAIAIVRMINANVCECTVARLR